MSAAALLRGAMHHTLHLDPLYIPKQPPPPKPPPVLQDFGGALDGRVPRAASEALGRSLASRVAHRRQQRRQTEPAPMPYEGHRANTARGISRR